MQQRGWGCIREDDVKLTLNIEGTEPQELYRLTSDPYEQNNLVADPDEEETIQRLQSAYREWLRDSRTRIGDTEEAATISPALRDWKGD